MRSVVRFSWYLFFTLMLKLSATAVQKNAEDYLHLRVRRQDGYVYNKPNISFDLPSRPSIESTQAPTVDRTLTQRMFYTYPAPAGGNTINVGSTAGTTASSTTTSAASGGVTSGYNLSTDANVGYNYGTSSPAENRATQVANTVIQNSASAVQTGTNINIQANSGYGNDAPSPTLSPTLQGSSGVSTSAPGYLPPIGGSGIGNLGAGGSINIGSVSVSSGTEQVSNLNTATQTGPTSVGSPSDNYLPPLVSEGASTGQTASSTYTKTSQKSSGGSVSIPSTDYLPPIPSPSPTPVPTLGPTSTSQPAVPVSGYLPPSNTIPNTGNVPKPPSGYLPPGFF